MMTGKRGTRRASMIINREGTEGKGREGEGRALKRGGKQTPIYSGHREGEEGWNRKV